MFDHYEASIIALTATGETEVASLVGDLHASLHLDVDQNHDLVVSVSDLVATVAPSHLAPGLALRRFTTTPLFLDEMSFTMERQALTVLATLPMPAVEVPSASGGSYELAFAAEEASTRLNDETVFSSVTVTSEP